jgi:hypothetical protein
VYNSQCLAMKTVRHIRNKQTTGIASVERMMAVPVGYHKFVNAPIFNSYIIATHSQCRDK